MAALRRDLDGRPTIAIALAFGLPGTIGVGLGLAFATRRAFAAYLAAWCTVATICIGGLAVLLIGYAANARWPAAIRRLGEAISSGLVAIAVLAIPLLSAPSYVWPWVDPVADRETGPSVNHGYLDVPFFICRTVLVLAICVVPAELLLRWSRRRDDRSSRASDHEVVASDTHGDDLGKERVLSSATLPVIGVALTILAFDWLMSLQPGWWSSAFGLYLITATLLAGMAMHILLAWRGVASRSMPLTPAHFHAMGRLLHAFVILWTYIAYFQAMLIQIANRPDEATFYVDRSRDGWRVVTTLLFVLTFALPFPLLFPRRLKRRAGYLAAIAMLLLCAHYLDMWWLVVPRISAAPIPSWTDVSAICALAGLTVATCAWRSRGSPLLPIGDPYLADGLAYETTT